MRANSALVTEPAQCWKRLQGAFAFKNSTKTEIYLRRRGRKGIAQGNEAQRPPPWITICENLRGIRRFSGARNFEKAVPARCAVDRTGYGLRAR